MLINPETIMTALILAGCLYPKWAKALLRKLTRALRRAARRRINRSWTRHRTRDLRGWGAHAELASRLLPECWNGLLGDAGIEGVARRLHAHPEPTERGITVPVELSGGTTVKDLASLVPRLELALAAPQGSIRVRGVSERADLAWIDILLKAAPVEPTPESAPTDNAPTMPVPATAELLIEAGPKLAAVLTDRSEWETAFKSRGLGTLELLSVDPASDGLLLTVSLGGSLTFKRLSARRDQVEAGLRAKQGSVTLLPGEVSADEARIRITTRDPLEQAVTWPGHPSADITQPAYVGRNPAGEPVMMNLLQRIVVAGTSGSGKSVFIRQIGSATVLSRNARLTYIDLKRVEAGNWEGLPGVTVATTPDQVVDVVSHLREALDVRLEAMKQRGEADHTPTEEEPAEILIVDEGAELTRQGLKDTIKEIVSLAQMGRAADFWLVWCSQKPTDKGGGLPSDIGSQAEATVGLRINSARVNRSVFGEDVEDGWLSNRLPRSKGSFLLKDDDHDEPTRCRGYLLTDADIRCLEGHGPVSLAKPEPGPVQAGMSASDREMLAKMFPEEAGVREVAKTDVREDVCMALLMAPGPMGVNELARATGRDKGNLSRVLPTVEGVVRDPETKKYRLDSAPKDVSREPAE